MAKIITLSGIHNELTKIYNENSGEINNDIIKFLPSDANTELSRYEFDLNKCLTAEKINNNSCFFNTQNVINENELITEDKLTYIDRTRYHFVDIVLEPKKNTEPIPPNKFSLKISVKDTAIKDFPKEVMFDVYDVDTYNNREVFIKTYYQNDWDHTTVCKFPTTETRIGDTGVFSYDKTQLEMTFITHIDGQMETDYDWAEGFKCNYYKNEGGYHIFITKRRGYDFWSDGYRVREIGVDEYIRIPENSMNFQIDTVNKNIYVLLGDNAIIEESPTESFDTISGRFSFELHVVEQTPVLHYNPPITRIYFRFPEKYIPSENEECIAQKFFNISFWPNIMEEDSNDIPTFGNNKNMSITIGDFEKSDTGGVSFTTDIPTQEYDFEEGSYYGPNSIDIYNIPFHVFIDKAYLRKITFTNIEPSSEAYDYYPFSITWKDKWCDGTV